MKSYTVISTQDDIPINGRGDHLAWNKAHQMSDFYDPWEDKRPQGTTFSALHNSDFLYFLFKVHTPNFFSIQSRNVQMEVAYSDRVELFFRKDESMSPYYCLEMDYLGRLLDNSAHHYRKMNYDWSWPSGFEFKVFTAPNFYSVEGYISKASLISLGLLKENKIQTGIFQAEFFKNQDHPDEVSTWWYAWVRPDTSKPDFHVPGAFGELILE